VLVACKGGRRHSTMPAPLHTSSITPSSMTMASSTRRTDILSLIHIRSDGRRPHEIRHMSCHLGALPSTNCGSALPTSACSGSALVSMGLTQVLCVVRGPCDIGRRSDELPDRYDRSACIVPFYAMIMLTSLCLYVCCTMQHGTELL